MINHNLTLTNDLEGWWCFIYQHKIFLPEPSQKIPYGKLSELYLPFTLPSICHSIGEYEQKNVYVVEVTDKTAEGEEQYSSLRTVLHNQNDMFEFAARAFQVIHFLDTHKYCGRCGVEMESVDWELAAHCSECNHRCYPRISPCIIVAIRRGNEILLARGKHSTSGFFSVLAGFVESGETLEQAVHREVMEEVGIQIKNVRYFSSQPWPFPHSLMVGYTAEYMSGDINICEEEIVEAQWFTESALPETPSTKSISGQLIEHTKKLMRSRR